MAKNIWLSLIAGVCLYVATIFSIFLVQGDGHASFITKFLLTFMLAPLKLFGAVIGEDAIGLVIGAVFWATIIFVILSVFSVKSRKSRTDRPE